MTAEPKTAAPTPVEGDTTRLGSVRIAPNVLATVAALNTQTVAGVARLADVSSGVGRLIGRGEHPGVRVEVRAGQAVFELHVVAKAGCNVVEMAGEIQRVVSDAVANLVGMPVGEINVVVEDVE